MREDYIISYKGTNHRYVPKAVVDAVKYILDKNKFIINRKLSGSLRQELSAVKKNFKYGCTGRKKWANKHYDALGPFVHIMLDFPPRSDYCMFAGQQRHDEAYKTGIYNMLCRVLGNDYEYQIGAFIQKHNSFKDDRNSGVHYHAVVSRLRFRSIDREQMDKMALDKTLGPLLPLYLLDDPIMYDAASLIARLGPEWRRVIHEVSRVPMKYLKQFESGWLVSEDDNLLEDDCDIGKELKSGLPLFDVRTKSGQDTMDRFRMLEYINNQPLHTFRYIRPKAEEKGKVKLFNLNRVTGEENAPHMIGIVEFVERYLIRPNRSTSTQWRSRGFLYPTAVFHGAAQALRNLGMINEATGKVVRVMDLPINIITQHARAFRAAYDSNDAITLEWFKQNFPYMKAPENEYVRRRDLREAEAKEEESNAVQSVQFDKQKNPDIQEDKDPSDDDDLI